MTRWTADFMTWNDSHIFPVLDVQEAATIYGASVAWAKSVAS